MKTWLVTGGAGFIGANFIIHILQSGVDIRIINLDKLTYAGNLENLKEIEDCENYKFIKGDICDSKLVKEIFTEENIDVVVNFAAESHVDRSIEDARDFVYTNITGTLCLLEQARIAWTTENVYREGVKFIQISTDEVYGSLGREGYFTETTPLDPHSPYSASKASGDLMVKAYFDTHKLPVNITRCSNNYGPYQFPEKLIPLIINNCLNKKRIPVYGDGLNIRDWLYVKDHCTAIFDVIEKGVSGEVYNIGGHNERTNIYIVKKIIEYINKNVDDKIDHSLIEFVEDRKGHDRRYGIDPAKIKKDLGWEPRTPFEEGITKTIEWYLSNKEWLNN